MSQPPLVPYGAALARVREIDTELTSLYARARRLLTERAGLIARSAAPEPTTPPAPAPAVPAPGTAAPAGSPVVGPGPVTFPAGGPSVAGPWGVPGARPVREASAVGVQTLLLTLGGLLLGAAAIVFALVAWRSMGIGGRAAVLAAVTAVALAVPVALVRRRLVGTAETIAAVGLLMALLDTYLARRLDLADLAGLDGAPYAAGVLAVAAAGWAWYGRALPALRGPLPTALALAQFPLPLAVAPADDARLVGAALLVTAAADLVLLRYAGRVTRVVALVGGSVSWLAAALTGLAASFDTRLDLPAAALLVAAGALAFVAAPALGAAADVATVLGVLTGAAGVVAVLRAGLDDVGAGGLLAVTLVGVVVAAGTRLVRRPGAVVAAGFLLVPGLIGTAYAALTGLGLPLATAEAPWTGVADPSLPDLPPALLAVAVLTAAGLALAAPAGRSVLTLPGPVPLGTAAAVAVALIAPVSFALPYGVTLGGIAALVLAAAVAGRTSAPFAGVTAGFGGLLVLWSLAYRPATLVVLAALALVAVALAGTARQLATRAGAAAATVGLLAAEAAAVPLAADAPVTVVGLTLLGVAAAAALAAALVHGRAPSEALAVEVAGVPVALAGLLVAATGGATDVAIALLLLGGILAAAAIRPGRRVLGWPAVASGQLAAWIAAADAGITAPEAYTVPLTVALLALGFLRRRVDATLSSWPAYGLGLTVTALPSLAASGSGGLRPLLLGAGALATVVVGAHWRLQAPLGLGAGVLVWLALDQLGPALAELTAELPRWLPLALGGVVLLVLGSTYERRLVQLRHARDAFQQLA